MEKAKSHIPKILQKFNSRGSGSMARRMVGVTLNGKMQNTKGSMSMIKRRDLVHIITRKAICLKVFGRMENKMELEFCMTS